MKIKKEIIREKLIKLVNRRQKQADMRIIPLSMEEARAISVLKIQLDRLKNTNDYCHKIMVRQYQNYILRLLPGPRTKFFKFRETIKDIVRLCEM